MQTFFAENPDYVGLFYGASFFLLAVAAFLLHLRQRFFDKRGRAWLYLCCFALSLSGYEALIVGSFELMQPSLWHAERNFLLAVAFVELFAFCIFHFRLRIRLVLSALVLAPLIAGTLIVLYSFKDSCVCEAVIRLFLGFPASLLAAIVFWRGALVEKPVFSRPLSRFIGAVFLVYGLLAGIVAPEVASGFPVFLGERRFFELVGLPVSVFRGALASLLAYIFVWRATRSAFYYRPSKSLRRRSSIRLLVSFVCLYLFFLVFGWHLVRVVTVHERSNVRRLALKDARLYAEVLLASSDIDVLGLTQGSAYPALRHAHHRMLDLAQKDSFARALYLVRLEGDRPVFLVGSQAQVFPSGVEPSFGRDVPVKPILDAFRGRRPTFTGSHTDEQGRDVFTVFLPLEGPEGSTSYLLAVDLDGRRIFAEIRRVRLFALMGVKAFLVLLIIGYGFLIIYSVKNTELEVQKVNLDKAVTNLRETEALLARSDETFRGILNNSPNAIFGFDRDLRLIFWNQGASRLYGYEKHEVLDEKDPVKNRRIMELLGMEDQGDALARVFSGETLVQEVAHRTKAGSAVDVDLTVFPVKDPQGNILFAMGLVQDISEHKRIELVLAQERDRLRIVAAHIGAGLCLIDRSFKIQWLNEVMEGWFGKMDAVQGRTCFGVFHQREGVCADCPTERAFLTGKISTSESRVSYPDGREMVFSVVSSPVKDENGFTHQVLELVLDVTERKQLEEDLKRHTETLEALVEERTRALQASESMFRRLFESALDGILIIDAEHGSIIDVNPYLLQLLEMTREEILGLPLAEAPVLRDNRILCGIPGELKDTVTVFHDEVTVVTPQKREIIAEVRASWYTVEGRRVIQCHLRNITERKKIEKIKSEFVSMVSHELRTPLSAIKEGVEIVADGTQGKLSRDQKVCLEIALSNIRRLNRLIGDILDISKIQSNLLTVRIAACDVAETVDQVYNLAKIEIEKHGLVLVTDIEKGLPHVLADRDRFIQVLMNLLNNATKFTREQSRIRLTVRRVGKEIEFAVADEGPGIPEEEMARLFGRFVQLDSTLVRRVGGTGLGLYISKNLVDAMKGRIWAESVVGEGAVFKFILPAEKA